MKKLFNKKNSSFLVLILVIFSFIFVANGASANWAQELVGGIANILVSILGWILAKLMGVLIYVAQYNDFINADAVVRGWIVARDVANMFFVIILLIIAFGTILQIESYNYKKWLPKLILMAILINFSKTICGLLIDASQVIMLTFVNAFSDIGPGALTKMLGVADWQSLKGVQEDIKNWEIVSAYVLAVIYALITLVVIAAMVGILVMRMIMIWVYVVLSPFAYLLAAFPGGASYSSQWWKEFTKNLIVGPVLAFFIWLSFASLGTPDNTPHFGEYEDKHGNDINCKDLDMADAEAREICESSSSNVMIRFIIAIGMLLGGMKIAQEIGGAGGSIAGKAMGKIKGVGLAAAGGVGGYALAKAKGAGKATGRMAKTAVGTGLGTVDRALGNRIDKNTGGRTNFGTKGYFGTNARELKNSFGKVKAVMSGKMVGDETTQELNSARRDYFEEKKKKGDAAVMSFAGKKYKEDKESGEMRELDENGTMTDKALKHKEKNVKSMTSWQAAKHDSVKDNMRANYGASDKKQTEKVEARQKEFEGMNMSKGEIDRLFESDGTSATDRMALSLIKAKNGDFKDEKQVAKAKKFLGGNKALSSKFSNSIDEKQPDLNYNLEPGSIDMQKFEQKVASGKIKLDASNMAALNPDILEIFQKNNVNFEAQITKIAKDLNPKDFDKLTKNLNEIKEKRFASGDTKGAQTMATITANINGNWGQSFKNDKGVVDQDALAKYISTSSGKNLNNMSVDDYKSLDSTSKDNVLSNITAGKLAAMMRDDSNAELVRSIRDDIQNKVTLSVTPGANKIEKNKTDILANAALLSY